MIKARNGKVEGKGTNAELLADLAQIIHTMIKKGEFEVELIDLAVDLGKAGAKGETKKFMANKIKELLEKKTEAETIAINLSELIKQVKEEKDGE